MHTAPPMPAGLQSRPGTMTFTQPIPKAQCPAESGAVRHRRPSRGARPPGRSPPAPAIHRPEHPRAHATVRTATALTSVPSGRATLRKPLTLAAVLQQARTILSGLPSTITEPDCRRPACPPPGSQRPAEGREITESVPTDNHANRPWAARRTFTSARAPGASAMRRMPRIAADIACQAALSANYGP